MQVIKIKDIINLKIFNNKQPNFNYASTTPYGMRIGLTKAGDNVLRNSYSNFASENPKTSSNYLSKIEANHVESKFTSNSFQKLPHAHHDSLYPSKSPLAMAARSKDPSSFQKSKFQSKKTIVPIKVR